MAKFDTIEELSGEDQFDSRDIVEWQEELQDAVDAYEAGIEEAKETGQAYLEEVPEDIKEARATLKALKEIEDSCGREWPHGGGYVRESHWKEYAEQLADDCGTFDTDSPMYRYVDWDMWARDLQMDYSSIDINGVTFYYRD